MVSLKIIRRLVDLFVFNTMYKWFLKNLKGKFVRKSFWLNDWEVSGICPDASSPLKTLFTVLEDEITTCDSSESLEKFEQDLDEIELTQKQITKLIQRVFS